MSPSSISNHSSCLQNSKNVFLFSMRPMVLGLWSFKGQRQIQNLYRGEKIKLLRFSWTRSQIVCLHKRVQKNNSLHYLICQVNKIRWFKVNSVFFDILTNIKKPKYHIGSANYYFSESSCKDEQFDTLFKEIGVTLFLPLYTFSIFTFDL